MAAAMSVVDPSVFPPPGGVTALSPTAVIKARRGYAALFQEVLALLEKILAFLKKAAGNNSFVDQVSNVAEVETSADLLDLVEEAAEIVCRDPGEEDEEDAGVNQVFLGCHSCLRSYQLCDS